MPLPPYGAGTRTKAKNHCLIYMQRYFETKKELSMRVFSVLVIFSPFMRHGYREKDTHNAAHFTRILGIRNPSVDGGRWELYGNKYCRGWQSSYFHSSE